MRPCTLAPLLTLLLAALPPGARAAEPPLPKWELGAFGVGVSQQAYPGSDQNVGGAIALPFFIYRGEILRADRGALGVRAVRTPQFDFNLGFSASLGSASSDIDARRGMPDLGTLVELGPRLVWRLGGTEAEGRWQAELPLRGVLDLSDRLAWRGVSVEPELQYRGRRAGGWGYVASASVVVASQRLNDVFYGVAPSYATADRPPYEARGGLLAWRAGLSVDRQIGPDWRFFTFVRLDSVAGAANADSPLVRTRHGATLGLGLSYTWLRSAESAAD